VLDLVTKLDGLKQGNPRALRTLCATQRLLLELVDAMGPQGDPRVKPLRWQIAMLAEALERNGYSPKVALITAMEELAPDRVNDQRFQDTIARTYRKLREGHNPAKHLVLSIPPELIGERAEK
jgi:hypothetical protein